MKTFGMIRPRPTTTSALRLPGGLLAALANRYLLPAWGWRWLFAASLVPVVTLSLARWRMLAGAARLKREAIRPRVLFVVSTETGGSVVTSDGACAVCVCALAGMAEQTGMPKQSRAAALTSP